MPQRDPVRRAARASALSALVLLAPAGAGAQRTIADRTYDCRIVASTREFPYGVHGIDLSGAPGMNAWGQVLFLAESRSEADERIDELRVGRGDTDARGMPRTHAVARAGRTLANDPLGPFDILHDAAIEDGARVVFRASDPPTGGPVGQGIYRVFTDHPADAKPGPLYASEALGGAFLGFGELGGANPSHVSYSGHTAQGGFAFYRSGQVVARHGEDGLQSIVAPVVIHPFQPWVAFAAVLEGPQGGGAVVVDGARYDEATGFAAAFRGVSIGGSAFPIVAYARSFVPGVDTWQLVRHNGLGAAVWVDADEDPFEFFADPRQISVNTAGDVAFVSSPSGDGDTLLVADGGDVIHRVACADMFATFGTPVFFDLALSPRGMNGDGQIAFLARAPGLVPETGDFETFVVRADPRPGQGAPPTSCAGLADGVACDDGDPITAAACVAQQCAVDPVSAPPTSCIGLADETVCDDGLPGTVSFCSDQECIPMQLPVPEPGSGAAALAAGAALATAAARHARPPG